MKYRKKPVVIEAIQWNGRNAREISTLVAPGDPNRTMERAIDSLALLIHTLEGTMQADVGDWIIRGVKGEVYPCKPDIFAATYEPADSVSLNENGVEVVAALIRESSDLLVDQSIEVATAVLTAYFKGASAKA